MHDVRVNWRDFYGYATEALDTTGDGYWLFVPTLAGEIELFQVSVMVTGESVASFATTVVTPGGVRRHEVNKQRGAEPVAARRDPDRLCLSAGSLLTISSDEPHDVFRVRTTDADNDVSADLSIRPATPLYWDIVGSDYRTTLDSVVEGTVTIDGRTHRVSSLGAFEHSSWNVPSRDNPPPPGSMPPFWQYEYVQWSGDGAPFGTFLWHSLGDAGQKVQASEFHTSSTSGAAEVYDTYDIAYGDVTEHDGLRLPGSWEVKATRGEETFSYRAEVRQLLTSPGDGAARGFSDFLLDCRAEHRGPAGTTQLRGRGRTEYIVISHNPVAG